MFKATDSTNKIVIYLQSHLSLNTFEHSKGTKKEAGILAERFGEDVKKAELAGLLHDCAKCDDVLKLAQKYKVKLDSYMTMRPEIAHGLVGAELARSEFGIYDAEILNAIIHHTLGRENMTKLEKILFVADFTEENRSFDGVDKIRELAKKNLDDALIECIASSLIHVLHRNLLIHPQSVHTYNMLVNEKERRMRK